VESLGRAVGLEHDLHACVRIRRSDPLVELRAREGQRQTRTRGDRGQLVRHVQLPVEDVAASILIRELRAQPIVRHRTALAHPRAVALDRALTESCGMKVPVIDVEQ
jgi:hypothetical protein